VPELPMEKSKKKKDERLKVLFVSPEVVPFAKTGGLADVSGSLPIALKKLEVDVRVVLPLYRMVQDREIEFHTLFQNLELPLGKDILKANIVETRIAGDIPVYMIDREDLYDRPNLYGNANGDYYDNLERFAFFSHAALLLSEAISLSPDIVHCHDWQTGLVPALLKGPYSNYPMVSSAATVFTVHNLGYQGVFPAEKVPMTGLPSKEFFHMEGFEFWGKISLLKAGIVYADGVTTVSTTYARQIQTPEYGMGMEGVLSSRRRVLHGILNGVDYDLWDPAKDTHIAMNYSPDDMAGKKKCKARLVQEMALDSSLIKRPLGGIISRLDSQKGLDLVVKILDEMLDLDVGLVVLGSGDESIQADIQDAARRRKGRIRLFSGFNDPLAHRIMAGADMLLIPSRYEPCGLTQMYALKYGNVPVVRATGGLADTIKPFDIKTGKGNGFTFGPYEPKAFFKAVRKAVNTYDEKRVWDRIVANGMQEDFSWQRSAKNYKKLYESFLKE
jgi:starch synthase